MEAGVTVGASTPIDMSFEDLFQRIGTKAEPTARCRVKKHLL